MTAVRSYLPIITNRADEWISCISQQLGDKESTNLDISQWSSFFAYDVISQLCFGEEFGFAREGKDRWGLVEGFRRGLYSQGIYARVPWWHETVKKLPLWAKKWVDAGANNSSGLGLVIAQRDRLVEERVREREDPGYKHRGDILDQ